MNRILHATRARRWASVALALAWTLSVGSGSAGASTEIERVWSFKGGEVAIKTLEGGLEGVVVTPTTFDECPHQAGEVMWTHMTLQPDGSYWGLHQWLFEKTCAPNPELGPTAWRVLQKPDGSRYLLVCFSQPGKSQPTIAANGTPTNASFGCVESAPTAPLPVVGRDGPGSATAGVITFRKTVVLPKPSLCVRGGSLKLKLHDPRRDPLKEVLVRVRGRRVADVHGVARLKQGIVLKGLPAGTYTIEVTATTVLDQRLTGRRHYRSCGRGSSTVPLHGPKHHRQHH